MGNYNVRSGKILHFKSSMSFAGLIQEFPNEFRISKPISDLFKPISVFYIPNSDFSIPKSQLYTLHSEFFYTNFLPLSEVRVRIL